MKIGSTNVASFRLGEITPSKVYVGSTEVWSDVVAVVPEAVPSIAALTSEGTESAADVSWTTPADGGSPITGYNIYYSFDFGTTYTLHGNVASSPTTVAIPGRGGSQVYFNVRAVNSVGEGPLTTPTGTALSDGVPGAPTISGVTRQAGYDLYVEWFDEFAVTPAVGDYEVEYTPAAGVATVIPTANLGYYTIDLDGINSGVEYTIRVRSCNMLGCGPWSEPAYATPADVPNVADYLYASTSMSTQGAIAIDGVIVPGSNGSTITSFDVQLNQSDDFGSPEKEETFPYNGTDTYTSGTVTGLAGGALYYIRIRFTNGVGNSGWSNSFTQTASDTPPAQVTGFSVTADYPDWDFAWTAPSDGGDSLTGYELQESAYDNEWLPETGMLVSYPLSSDTSSTTSITSSAGTTRYFRIRAINGLGNGAWSDVVSATTPDVPAAPTITSAFWDGTSTQVAWSSGSDGGSPVTGQTFYFNGTITSPDSTGANTANFNFDARSYNVEMSETNAVGEGALSAMFTAVGIPDTPIIDAAYWDGTDTIVEYTDGSDGGSAITSRTFRFSGSETAPSSDSAGVATFAGTDWNGYEVDMRATNVYGSSAYSGTLSVTNNS